MTLTKIPPLLEICNLTESELKKAFLDVQQERDALRRELKSLQTQAQYTEAIETISEAIVIYDAEGCLVVCNRNFCNLYGYSEQEVKPGIHFTELGRIDLERGNVAIGDEIGSGEAYLQRRLEYRKKLHGDFIIHLKDGRWIKSTDRRMKNGSFVSIQVDITQLKNNEIVLAEAKELAEFATRSKSEFLANMSHDLRTPLNAIIGFSEIIKEEMYGRLQNDRYKDYLENIHSSGQQLLNLVNEILDISKLESGDIVFDNERFNPVEFSKNILKTFEHTKQEKNLEFEVMSSPGFPKTIHADKRATTQIINNLVSNACKHTPTGGKISITWQMTADNEISLSIADSGTGIPKDLLEKLGEPFLSSDAYVTQKSEQSTGLGFYITKNLIEANGGRVTIESELGAGTTVIAFWPMDILKPEF